tara:strand:+ start:310 stop:1311 length:1002 start_codon:yes stop_codon:yes gene_type:complete
VYSKPLENHKNYPKSISLAILTPASNGSGFIIGKKKNIYFFITAAHVAISDPKDEEYWVYLQKDSQKRYRVLNFKQHPEFRDKDLVIGSFISNEIFEVPLLFPLGEDLAFKVIKCGNSYTGCLKPTYYTFQIYQKFYGNKFDYSWLIQGNPKLFGFSTPTKVINIPLFRSSKIEMMDQLFGNKRGYEAVYKANTTVPGMSGGPIIGHRLCPDNHWYNLHPERMESSQYKEIKKYPNQYTVLNEQTESEYENWNYIRHYPGIIAMHGISEEYGQTGSRSGISLGIPMRLLKDFFKENAEEYGIISGKKYFEKVFNLCFSRSYRSHENNYLQMTK